MLSLVRDRVAVGLFIVLLAGSVGLKALKGPQVRESTQSAPGLLESEIVRNLDSRGFTTRLGSTRLHGTIVFAARGKCRLSVRDAGHVEWEKGIYERDAVAVGPMRFLMAGKSYDSPPSLAILVERMKGRLTRGLQLAGNAPVALAFAASSACGDSDFGLSKTQVPA
jgi:hypothetical protein